MATGQLFSRTTQALFYNYKQLPVQRMLDFDFLCGSHSSVEESQRAVRTARQIVRELFLLFSSNENLYPINKDDELPNSLRFIQSILISSFQTLEL
ncbi:hypothetical protein DY000_02062979 [Brassica cretica]|uniref:Uncharacterized protein n=1 Tax=Brassica cretica TaxID=69181 RepID=A0ABQ7AWY0_BRACR|nr:hypothetical protein DY000_02062979 [Brassica cretica]